jgi:hypothetical protein
MYSLGLYLVVINPVLKSILTKGKYSKQKAIFYAVAFVAAVAAVTMYMDAKLKEPNYFELLEVRTDATSAEVEWRNAF